MAGFCVKPVRKCAHNRIVIKKSIRLLLTSDKQNPDNKGMDCKLLIAEIRAAGLSQIQIAERLGRSQAWVSAASSGKYLDLKWGEGHALIALHQQVCGTATPDALPSSQDAA